MTGAEVFGVMSVPKTDHVYSPHCHHRQTVSLSDDVTMAEIEQTVPAHCQ